MIHGITASNIRRVREPADPLFSDVVLLLLGEGVDNGTIISDSSTFARTPQTQTAGIVTSTAQFVTPPSSIFFPASQTALQYASSTDFSDSGAYTIECWLRFPVLPTSTWYFLAHSAVRYHTIDPSGSFQRIDTNSATIGTLSVNTWYHYATVQQSDGSTQVFLNGTPIGLSQPDSSLTATASPFSVCSVPERSDLPSFRGYMQGVRYTRAARYVSSFTPPTTYV